MTSNPPEIIVVIEDAPPPIEVVLAEVGLVGPPGSGGSGGLTLTEDPSGSGLYVLSEGGSGVLTESPSGSGLYVLSGA